MLRQRAIWWSAALLAVASLSAGSQAVAEDVHLGVVVSTLGTNLTIADEEGKGQQSFEVPQDAVITLNGKPAKLEELTQGDLVKVTTDTKDGKTTLKSIDAKSAATKSGRNS